MISKRLHVLFGVFFFIVGNICFAQDSEEDVKDTLKISDLYIDFAIPDITAFSLMENNTNEIGRPGNLKEFAIGIANIVNKEGKLSPGIALEWTPTITIMDALNNKKRSNATKVEVSPFKSPQISVGTSTDSSNLQIAVGLKWVIIDKSNPLNDPAFIDKLVTYFYSEERMKRVSTIADYMNIIISTQLDYFKEKLNLDEDEIDWIFNYYGAADPYVFQEWSDTTNIKTPGIIKQFYIDAFLAPIMEYDGDEEEGKSIRSKLNAADNAVFNLKEFQPLINALKPLFGIQYDSEEFKRNILQLKEDYKKENWNAPVVQFSGGILGASPDFAFNGIKANMGRASFHAAFPLGRRSTKEQLYRKTKNGEFIAIEKEESTNWFAKHSQMTFQYNMTHYADPLSMKVDSVIDMATSDSTLGLVQTADAKINSHSLGVRILLGSADMRFSTELQFVHEKDRFNDVKTNSFRYAIGGEFKLTDGFWIELVVGGEVGKAKSTMDDTVTKKMDATFIPGFTLKHAFKQKPRYKM